MTTIGDNNTNTNNNNNNNNNNNQPPAPNNSSSSSSSTSSSTSSTTNNNNNSQQFYRLKVEDALSYLDQVKLQFESQPHVYNHFLDIMKEFKSQTIDTPGVISRVSNLFRGHTDLIEGFNTFLPPGYKIEVQENNSVHFTAPNSTLSTLVQPINNTNYSTPPPPQPQPLVPSTSNIPTLVNLTQPNNSTSTATIKTSNEPLILTPLSTPTPTSSSTAAPALATFTNNVQQSNLSVKILPTSTTIGGTLVATSSLNVTSGMAQPINLSAAAAASPPPPPPAKTQLTVNSLTTASNVSQQQQQHPQSQVEFGHAINYVNKIKSRFSNQPDIYKSFLEILHTYQKQQKNLKEGVTSGTQNFLSESEVYAKVAKLFKNQEDLLVEFSQFLPDANSTSATNNTTSPSQGLLASVQQPKTEGHISSIIASNLNEQQPQQVPFLQQSILNVPIQSLQNCASSTSAAASSSSSSSSSSSISSTNSSTKLVAQESSSKQKQPSSTPPTNSSSSSSSTTTNKAKSENISQIPISTQQTNSLSNQLPMTPINQNLSKTLNHNNKRNSPYHHSHHHHHQHNQNKKPKIKDSLIMNETPKPIQQEGSVTSLNEITFFERLKKALRTQQVYDNFLKCLALFNQDIVSRSELIALVEPFLGKFANLYRWFKDYVENKPLNSSLLEPNNDENTDSTLIQANNTNRHIYLPPGNNYSLEIDYLSCKQYGASYRDISSYPQALSTGQSELCKQVLNGIYVSFPSWSEDSTFISSKKNQYEELIFRIEDERFELDVVLETNLSTIRVLENVLTKIGHMTTDELNKYRLGNNLGGTSDTVHIKAIQRVYGDKSKDFIDGLKRNPSVAVPLVLKRLKAKDEEWREAKKTLEKQWSEQIERNYLKSLDHCAVPFKQNDQKHLKTKSLINEIEDAKEEAANSSSSSPPSSSSSSSNNNSHHHQPHLTLKYEDKSILEDAAALIIHHVKRQTTIQREDKHRIKEIVYHFLPDLLYVQRGALSDDESSPEPTPPTTNTESNTQQDRASEDAAVGHKKLRSASSNSSQTRHTDTNKRRLTDSDHDRSSSTQSALNKDFSSSTEDMYRLYFVDYHWYLFYRYHHILCDRLHRIYKHSIQIAEQNNLDSKRREQSVAEALKLRNKSEVSPDDYYPAFLDIVRHLLDGNMESTQYEDTLRDMFGIHAYISFTLDKVVQNCVRQLQHIVQDQISISVKQIYSDEIRANNLLSNSNNIGTSACLQSLMPSIVNNINSGGGCGGKVSNMSYSSVINAEQAYQKKVEALLNNQRLFKIISYKNSCRLTLELMDTQESEDEDDEPQEDITDIEKWSQYVDNYCNNTNTVKAGLLNRRAFLNRNVHCLKHKYEKQTKEKEADVHYSDNTVYKFQMNSFKLVHGVNSTSIMYRKNSLKNARKSHEQVSLKMHNRFQRFNNRWLKENSISVDAFKDALLGNMEYHEPYIETNCVKETNLKIKPYHEYTKYKVGQPIFKSVQVAVAQVTETVAAKAEAEARAQALANDVNKKTSL